MEQERVTRARSPSLQETQRQALTQPPTQETSSLPVELAAEHSQAVISEARQVPAAQQAPAEWWLSPVAQAVELQALVAQSLSLVAPEPQETPLVGKPNSLQEQVLAPVTVEKLISPQQTQEQARPETVEQLTLTQEPRPQRMEPVER